MQPIQCRGNEKVWIKRQRAVRPGIGFNEPGTDSVRIYLLVPGRIQRVGKINAFSVAAYLHHLRTAIQRYVQLFRMGRATYDSADMKHGCELRAIGNRDVVTAQFPGSPAGYIKPFIIKRQVKVSNEGWNRLETLQQRRQQIRVRRLSWNFNHLCCAPMTIIALPQPDRCREVFERNDDSGKAKRPRRVMRRAQLQNHLMFFTEINRLLMPPLSKIPNVQPVTVATGKQMFRIEPVLQFIWYTPFTTNQCVVPEMPPEIISQFLRSTIDFPTPQHVEIKVIQKENSAWAAAVPGAQGANVNSFRTAMYGVRPRVAGAGEHLFGLNDLNDFELCRIRLGIHNVNAARA